MNAPLPAIIGTIVACPICGEGTSTVLTRELRRGTGTVYHCQDCDLGFLVGETDPERYKGAYREEVSHRADGGPTTPQEVFDTYRPYQADRLRIIAPYVRPYVKYKQPGTRVIEYGAGAGQFISHLRGRCGGLYAVEPDRASCQFIKRTLGIKAAVAYNRFGSDRPPRVDVACAFQVLEHVEDPVAFLAQMHATLRDGGVAIVEVPNLNDPLRSVWKVKEYERFYFHADHRLYFSGEALEKAALKAGFTGVRDAHYTQDYTLLNHLSWLVNRAPQADCHAGLMPLSRQRASSPLAQWVLGELAVIEAQYTAKLVSQGLTSNLTLVLTT